MFKCWKRNSQYFACDYYLQKIIALPFWVLISVIENNKHTIIHPSLTALMLLKYFNVHYKANKKLPPTVPLGNCFYLLIEKMAGINSKKIQVETSSSAWSISNNSIIPLIPKKQTIPPVLDVSRVSDKSTKHTKENWKFYLWSQFDLGIHWIICSGSLIFLKCNINSAVVRLSSL